MAAHEPYLFVLLCYFSLYGLRILWILPFQPRFQSPTIELLLLGRLALDLGVLSTKVETRAESGLRVIRPPVFRSKTSASLIESEGLAEEGDRSGTTGERESWWISGVLHERVALVTTITPDVDRG